MGKMSLTNRGNHVRWILSQKEVEGGNLVRERALSFKLVPFAPVASAAAEKPPGAERAGAGWADIKLLAKATRKSLREVLWSGDSSSSDGTSSRQSFTAQTGGILPPQWHHDLAPGEGGRALGARCAGPRQRLHGGLLGRVQLGRHAWQERGGLERHSVLVQTPVHEDTQLLPAGTATTLADVRGTRGGVPRCAQPGWSWALMPTRPSQSTHREPQHNMA